MDRAVTWLIDKINESDLDPIEIQPGNIWNHIDVKTALEDPRSFITLKQAQKHDFYFTPDFLETFDLRNICGRDYLKIRMKFASVKLGFTAQLVTGSIKNYV